MTCLLPPTGQPKKMANKSEVNLTPLKTSFPLLHHILRNPSGCFPYQDGNRQFHQALGNVETIFHCHFHTEITIDNGELDPCGSPPHLGTKVYHSSWINPHCPHGFRLSPELHTLSSRIFWVIWPYIHYPMPLSKEIGWCSTFPSLNQKQKVSF